MSLLLAGIIVFFSVHLIPTFPNARDALTGKLGANAYKGLFALISLAGFVAIVIGKGHAPFIAVWNPPVQLAIVTKILMLPAFILLVAAYVPSNIKRKIKHPMLAGVKLWAVGHLFINGDLASMLLFGSFLAYSIYDMISANKRLSNLVMDQVVDLEPKPLYMDALVVILGVVVYGGVAMHHMQLFGVPVF